MVEESIRQGDVTMIKTYTHSISEPQVQKTEIRRSEDRNRQFRGHSWRLIYRTSKNRKTRNKGNRKLNVGVNIYGLKLRQSLLIHDPKNTNDKNKQKTR